MSAVLLAVVAALGLLVAPAAAKPRFRIAWSIYVGWMPWDYAAASGILKKWADRNDVEIELVRMDYIPSACRRPRASRRRSLYWGTLLIDCPFRSLMPVAGNIVFGLELQEFSLWSRLAHPGRYRERRAAFREQARRYLERTGLGADADKYPYQLSGGCASGWRSRRR